MRLPRPCHAQHKGLHLRPQEVMLLSTNGLVAVKGANGSQPASEMANQRKESTPEQQLTNKH